MTSVVCVSQNSDMCKTSEHLIETIFEHVLGWTHIVHSVTVKPTLWDLVLVSSSLISIDIRHDTVLVSEKLSALGRATGVFPLR